MIPAYFFFIADILLLAFGVHLYLRARVRMRIADSTLQVVQEEARQAQEVRSTLGRLKEANQHLEESTRELQASNDALALDLKRKALFIDLNQALTVSLDLKTILGTLLRKLRGIVAFQAAGVFLLNQDSTELFLAASDGLYQQEMSCQLRPEMGVPAIVAQTERPLLFADPAGDPRFATILRSARLGSALYHPIAQGGQVYGVISLWHVDAGAYAQGDVDRLAPVTGEAARAIRNAEIYQELDARLNFIVSLWETSKNLSQMSVQTDSGAWQRILGEVITSTHLTFGADRAVLFHYDAGHRELVPAVSHGFGESSLPLLQSGLEQSTLGLTHFLETSFQVGDLQRDPRFASMERVAREEALVSMLWSPLTGRRRSVGALALFSSSRRVWTQMELQWQDIFTNMLSTTLENASLFQDLASEKSQLQVLVDNVPEGVFTTDARGRIQTWNVAAQVITGWRLGDVLGQACSAFIKCQTVDEILCERRCPLRVAMEGRTRFDSGVENIVLLKSNQERLPVFVTTGPIQSDDGRVVGAILVFRDITKEKEIEQIKEDFLATITHDLKSPLASVMGYSELLLNPKLGPLNQRQKEFIDAITRSSKTLQFLIDNILEITRMEAGRMVFHPGLFNLALLLNEVHEMFLPLASPKSLSLETKVDDGLIVRGDRDRIKEVFINLYANAIKFTRARGRVETRVVGTRDRVEIRVGDTGKGIPADQIGRLFEKFAQLKRDEKQGTGLGLYIVRRILQAHGEEISVESEVGVGTTFIFGLPRVTPDTTDSGRRMVLIVNQDGEAAELMQRSLETEGITTVIAANGPDALRAVSQRRPQLAVVDSTMLDGAAADLLGEIKTASAACGDSVRVVLLCDWREEDRVDADLQIYRPLEGTELLQKVRALIRV